MKKTLLALLAMTLLTTGALAAEDTLVYGDTTYVYGGEAVETTDDNENGCLEGLVLRGVDEATYYSAGDGFVYFTPATQEVPAQMILDNATLIADFCVQAVTDVDLFLVGDNLLQATSPEYFCFNAMEGFDSNMELLDLEDYDYGALTINGEGSLSVISSGYVAFNVGQFALHSGDVSIALDGNSILAILISGDYEPKEQTGFWMDGGTLDIDMGQDAGWGVEVFSGDIAISGGSLTIRGGSSESTGMIVAADTRDVAVSITGGATIIEHNGPLSFGTCKNDADLAVYAVVDFTNDPEGVFSLGGMFHFCDVLDIDAQAGSVAIPIFDGVMVTSDPQLTVTGLDDYLYCVNAFSSFDLGAHTLTGFTASMVGAPAITQTMRMGLTFPYLSENNPSVAFTFTRAQLIALLWDSMGCPEATIDNPFTDVSPEDGYYQAILWAVEQGITTGITATTFDPDALCTKGQALTFLYRNAGAPEVDVENVFADVSQESYLYDAVLWGIANTMMDVDAETFGADDTVLKDGAIAYLICMYQ